MMQNTRAAIYARYSGDNQRETSIDDQVRNCTKQAERERVAVQRVYSDKAISGAVTNRADYQRMLADAAAGTFDVLFVDDLSRLSRDDYEMKGVLRRFTWQGLRVVGVTDGYDSSKKGAKIHAGFKGLMNEIFLDDLRERTHRGQSGQALKGYNCGGRTYGYRNVPIEDSIRKDPYGRPLILAVRYEIDESQAVVVRDIYRWFAEGRGSLWIAFELNRRHVPSPRGGRWGATSVRGILDNDMYEGRTTWNRKRNVKNPDTGEVRRRPRPREDWIVTEQPDLRIVPPDIAEAVRCRRKEARRRRSGAFRLSPAQKYLLSGLMTCAECGGSIVIAGAGRYGCANYKSGGPAVCSNHLTVPRELADERILASIKTRLRTPEHFEHFKQTIHRFIEEHNAVNRSDDLVRQLNAAERTRENLLSAIKQGILTPTTKSALEEAEIDVADLRRQVSNAEPRSISAMLPRAIERYRDAVDHLEQRLQSNIEGAREALKSLLGDRIRIRRNGECLEALVPNHMPAILTRMTNYAFDSRQRVFLHCRESKVGHLRDSIAYENAPFEPTVISLAPSQLGSFSKRRRRGVGSAMQAQSKDEHRGDPT